MRQAYRSVVIFFIFLAAGCQSVGKQVVGIQNFAKVDDELYRGAQPSEAGIETLKIQGVRTVIDLRDDAVAPERAWVESRGIGYVRIPCNAARVEPEKIRAFLREVEAAPKPVFVHCRHGRDRTGLEVAMYRIISQGWDRERALRELYAHGYNWPLFPGIARYVRTFNAEAYTPAEVAAGGG